MIRLLVTVVLACASPLTAASQSAPDEVLAVNTQFCRAFRESDLPASPSGSPPGGGSAATRPESGGQRRQNAI
ncbi:MAG: hypothetical protein AAF882_21830 [Pseudomonadota bacterium]